MRSFSRDQLMLVILLTAVVAVLTLLRYLCWY
jgi:hypothetical protein